MDETLQSKISYIVGFVVGMSADLVAAKSLLRALEQAGNVTLPNELLDQATLIEGYRRGVISSADASGELAKDGLSDDKIATVLALSETLLQSNDLVNALYRKIISSESFYSSMQKLGVSRSNAEIISKNFSQLLQSGNVIDAEFRGLSTPGGSTDYANDLRAQGWSDERIDILRKIALAIPNVQDLENFAAWNVDDDTFAAAAGLDEGLPATFMEEAKKAGIPADLARRYWRSHWQVPSLFIIRELAQSGQVPETVVKGMLSALQLPPAFIPFIQASFQKQVTEAQIGELLKEGLITSDQVPTLLKATGLSDDAVAKVAPLLIAKATSGANADAQARKAAKAAEYGLTTADIITAYVDGLLTNQEAAAYLNKFGEPDDVISLQLGLADHKIAIQTRKANVQAAHDNYVYGSATEDDTRNALTQDGIDTSLINHYIIVWNKEIAKMSKQPTEAQLTEFAKKGLIDQPTYESQLGAMGYSNVWIQAFSALAFGTSSQGESPVVPAKTA